MKDRYYLRYDGTETERSFSGAEAHEMEAVARIHQALTRLDTSRRLLRVDAEAVHRESRHAMTPKQIRKDFEKFWAAGGATAAAYKDWIHGRRPTEPVRQRKHMRLVASTPPRSLRLPEKPKVLHREHLPPDDAA